KIFFLGFVNKNRNFFVQTSGVYGEHAFVAADIYYAGFCRNYGGVEDFVIAFNKNFVKNRVVRVRTYEKFKRDFVELEFF
ncbi:MAG: hypothetical protein ABIH78_01920, partial [Candidatus Peregrinibacteria bacterium]